MEAWQAASDGKLNVERTAEKESGDYQDLLGVGPRTGCMGKRAAEMSMSGPIPARDSCGRQRCISLACTKPGTRLGLSHTANFDDIMYNFQYGGDIAEYFGRYVRKLERREDITKVFGYIPERSKAFSCRTVSRFLYPCGRQSFIWTGHY